MDQFIQQIFENLDKWRHLPAYQLERRADIFFSVYLPEYIKREYQLEVELIIPEFPIKVDIAFPKAKGNRSFKIDYLFKFKNTRKIWFIELKTDTESVNEKQKKYLSSVKNTSMVMILNKIKEIIKASSSKKYNNLITLLIQGGFVKDSEDVFDIIVGDYEKEIVFVLPKKMKEDLEKDFRVIYNHDISSVIQSFPDELSRRFAKSLTEWATINADGNSVSNV
ncbi:MAG: hypothetical protein HY960_04525 [Ignavibacteriae bacterium]|nr:hypothetical protein [Ignavibacteriota bacterium]